MPIDVALLEHRLVRGVLPASVLLSRFHLLDDSARRCHAYNDPRHLPFYFYLGQQLRHTRRLLHLQVGLGLTSGCFCIGCHGVHTVTGINEHDPGQAANRLAKKNLQSVCRGQVEIYQGQLPSMPPQDVMLLEGQRDHAQTIAWLELLWPYLAADGIVCAEQPVARALEQFCLSKRRPFQLVKARYPIGLIEN